ncbi:MAG: hypothetical protein IAE82_18685 [Opitutaceae bacterium]|nr:hypothetical protein [Opitutaceae bacterium]
MRVSRGPALVFVLICCLLAVAAALPFFAIDPRTQSRVAFVAEIAADAPGRAELFYDAGEHFNARDAVSVAVTAGGPPVTCRFPLPDLGVTALRFDPTDTATWVEVTNPRFEEAEGRLLGRIGPENFEAVQQVRSTEVRADGFRVEIEPGQRDPILTVRLEPAHRLILLRGNSVWRHASRWATFAGVLLIGGWLVHMAWARLAGRVAPVLARHPVAGLAVVSVVAVAVQCHPVIFFGKSYVSPDIGTYLLYEGFPTLPGYQTEPLEDPKGSDTGAIFYGHLFAPKIVRDAILRDGELPLWNRYTMCGVPALGQGQLMFGELLSIPVVLSGGEAWAWDVRYVVARWMYAFGCGLAVWLWIRHLPSALIIAATAVFIGFFGFRLNHPAQFSLTAAPWILVAWLGLRSASGPRELAVRGALLALANWQVHVSGTVKEAAMIMVCLNFTGLVLVLVDRAPWRMRLVRAGWAGFWGCAYVLATAPTWMVFLGTLERTATVHTVAAVVQAKPWQFAGLFEDMLFRALWPGEPYAMPAANLVVLCGLGWIVIRPREAFGDRGAVALAVGFAATAAVVFGLVPASWILKVPLVANINHVDSTFATALVVIATVLAGGGIRLMCTGTGGPAAARDCLKFAAGVILLGWLYFGSAPATTYSPFFRAYLPSVALALAVVILVLSSARLRRSPGLAVFLLGAAAVVMVWRHGTYLRTPFDAYVVNPKVRASFHVRPPSVAFVDEHMTEPSRPNGLRYALFSGFNTMFGWEGIYGADPLRNGYLDEFARAAGILKLFWGLGVGDWSQWNEDKAATLRPALDALNVRYHLAPPGTPAERMSGLTPRLSADLDIYESETAWPRAFFASRLWSYGSVDEFVGRLKSGPLGQPFAAIQARDLDGVSLPEGVLDAGGPAPVTAYAATDYRLTNNTTTFRVRSDGPGVVVLTEGFVPEDFRVTLDGRQVDYFRANHAFKGIVIPGAGDHEVRFSYWPKEMNRALAMSAVGILLGLVSFVWAWRQVPRSGVS